MSESTGKRPLKILVVEDEEDDYQLLLRQLNRGGYQLEATRIESEDEFRAALATNEYQMIFADYLLPAFNAHSALQVYKNSGLEIPFIIVSGVIGEETAIDMIDLGANDYLLKDNLLRLNAIVNRELRDSQIRREHRLQREEASQGGVIESSAGTSVRLHLEAIRRLLAHVDNPAHRESLDKLLREVEKLAAGNLEQ